MTTGSTGRPPPSLEGPGPLPFPSGQPGPLPGRQAQAVPDERPVHPEPGPLDELQAPPALAKEPVQRLEPGGGVAPLDP